MKYEINVQDNAVRFSLLMRIAAMLGVTCRNEVRLTIRDRKTEKVIFRGVQQLKSGLEIYGSELRASGLMRGQAIEVSIRKA